jgi:hypothetical protein
VAIARTSQIMSLLNLASDIQEAIRFLPALSTDLKSLDGSNPLGVQAFM